MNYRPLILLTTASTLLPLAAVQAAEPTATLSIDVNRPAGQVSPLHHGLMTEEINHSYDGGLYAELVQNRAFLDNAQHASHWSAVQGMGATATMVLGQSQPLSSALPTSLRVEVANATRRREWPTTVTDDCRDAQWPRSAR